MATTIDTSSPYISSYSVNNVNSIDKISSGSAVNKAANDPSGLTIVEGLRLHERALSQSIENSTSGIALSNFAQDALGRQKDILSEIKQLTIQASSDTLNQDDRQIIAKEIDKKIENFETIADSTNYNGETLLKTKGDSSDDLSIVEKDKIVSIYKADTKSVSDSLKVFLGDFPAKSDVRENMLNVLNQSIDELSSYEGDFGSASNILESTVKKQLTEVTNTVNARKAIENVDFGKEVSSFNKTNLLSQVGYLMQTQANAHSQRTIEMLK